MQTINLLPGKSKKNKSFVLLIILLILTFLISLPILIFIGVNYHNNVKALSNNVFKLESNIETRMSLNEEEINQLSSQVALDAETLNTQSQYSFELFHILYEIIKGNPSITKVNLIKEVENNHILTLHYMNQTLNQILNELTFLQKYEIIEHLSIRQVQIEDQSGLISFEKSEGSKTVIEVMIQRD
ncbi:hypothetical protein VQL36_09080 [Chengkuizengella sp. SCS-71B]|uniref:hypothetical protein n=1 Tax=Chengkuizengella sp. SCS-71B TaxID=3115290 RepID=UPI0032C21FFC